MTAPRVTSIRSSKHGFTLLELLVAVSVFAVISTLLYGTLARTMRSRQAAVDHEQTSGRARAIFTWLARDLKGSFTIGTYPIGDKVFFSSRKGLGEASSQDAWLLDITAVSARGTTALDVRHAIVTQQRDGGDQARILYRLEPPAADNSSRQGLDLVRYEIRPPPTEIDLDQAARSIIATGVDALTLRFSDGTSWYDTWDAAVPGVQHATAPQLVEVEIRLRTEDGVVLPFVFAIEVPAGGQRRASPA